MNFEAIAYVVTAIYALAVVGRTLWKLVAMTYARAATLDKENIVTGDDAMRILLRSMVVCAAWPLAWLPERKTKKVYKEKPQSKLEKALLAAGKDY